MDQRQHNRSFKRNKFAGEFDIITLNARKAREYPASLNKINKQNDPQ